MPRIARIEIAKVFVDQELWEKLSDEHKEEFIDHISSAADEVANDFEHSDENLDVEVV